jgi:GNAT superfamily N-acetyltransferase
LLQRQACPNDLEISMKLVPCTEPYWDFVRTLRMDERVAHGFIEKANITPEQQKKYMAVHCTDFFIALVDEVPAGFVGCVGGDIRICTHPDFQRSGVGVFLMREIMKRFPTALARVKIENKASQRMMEASGLTVRYVIYGSEE